MNNNYEFDRIMWAIALSIIVFIASVNVGDVFYVLQETTDQKGFKIEISETTASGPVKKGLPDIIKIGQIMATASAEAGKSVFRKCAVCHTVDRGGANKVGPNLWDILNAKTARHSEFKYSKAMLERGADGKKWTYEELYRYLYSPKKYVPGTKMAFAGLKKDDDRANVIAYLRSLAGSPAKLPPVEKDDKPVS